MTPREFRRARQFRSPLGLRRQSASGDGAFARERELQAFEDRCPHESGVALPPQSMTLPAIPTTRQWTAAGSGAPRRFRAGTGP